MVLLGLLIAIAFQFFFASLVQAICYVVFGGIAHLIASFRAKQNLDRTRMSLAEYPPIHPLLMSANCLLGGATSAVLSLVFVPHHLIHDLDWQKASLLVVPAIVAVLSGIRRVYLRRRKHVVLRFERFGYVYLFGLGFGIVRLFRAI